MRRFRERTMIARTFMYYLVETWCWITRPIRASYFRQFRERSQLFGVSRRGKKHTCFSRVLVR